MCVCVCLCYLKMVHRPKCNYVNPAIVKQLKTRFSWDVTKQRGMAVCTVWSSRNSEFALWFPAGVCVLLLSDGVMEKGEGRRVKEGGGEGKG